MKKIYEITDTYLIKEILANVQFGTLALCVGDKPYSLPLNFVEIESEIFIHGAKKGKKIDMIRSNNNASFSVVEPYSILPSYFSTDDGNASPATHMFKSVIIDGKIEFVEDFEQKVKALESLMKKYQKEGYHKPLSDEIHKKIIKATCVYKLVPFKTSAKFHLGQNYSEKRFARVKEHLLKRETKKDIATLELMESFRE